MSLVNRYINVPNHDSNHKSFTQILDYSTYKQNKKSSISENLDRENTTCASLPTISENSQCDNIKVNRMDVIEGKWPNAFQANDLCLPPLTKEIKSRTASHDYLLPNLKRRPSTPRPVLLLRGNQNLLSDSLEVKRQHTAKTDENSNKILRVSKLGDVDDWHPLFSVSPNGSGRSSPDIDVPRSSCIQLQRSNSYSGPSQKPLLKREKIKACGLQNIF